MIQIHIKPIAKKIAEKLKKSTEIRASSSKRI